MGTLPDRECWSIDIEKSSLSFSLRHALLGKIRGEFRCWGGRVLLDPRAPLQPSVHVWVDLSSLDTGSRRRNDAILETELFDIQWQPGLVFDADRIEQTNDDRAILTGWLGLHCLRKQISVDVTLSRPPGEKAAELIATARAAIDRRAFGLRREATARDWLSERFVDRTIEMTAHIVATPAAPAVALAAAARTNHHSRVVESAREQVQTRDPIPLGTHFAIRGASRLPLSDAPFTTPKPSSPQDCSQGR
jgi:polyisoprenoid-binding protein YceI